MTSLYPAIEPYKIHRLKVSDIHELYIEECGNPEGKPIVFIHGGPGGGIHPDCRRYYDPKHYRIVLFDQRGAGKSTPHANLTENTTWNLVSDLEKIREFLNIDQWILFGGSWGSTLSLAYAVTHPDKTTGLVLRGIFLCRPHEIEWLYQSGAHRIYPDTWEDYIRPIPEEERGDLVKAFHKRLTGEDKNEQLIAAIAWSAWEGSASKLVPDDNLMHVYEEPEFAIAFARIENHFFINNAFFETDNFLLENVDKIKHLPCEIVHGRYDVVCPIENAWELHKAWPESKLHICQRSGHSAFEEEITTKLIDITDRFRDL